VSLVSPLSLAAIAAGADGLIVEVHINPAEAVCDKEQTLSPVQFKKMMEKIRALYQFVTDLP
jgi:3-deoxy-7-phosphoheptulonate synthase